MFQGVKQGLLGVCVAACGLAAAATGAFAGPVVSGDGTETCAYVSPLLGAGPCAVQIVTAHPLWMPDTNTGGRWISYGPTGYLDAGPVAPFDISSPLIRVTETFNILEQMELNIAIWADDTAEVFIDGISVFAPNFTQNICANGSIGCEPHELGFVAQVLNAGLHTLSFDVYQIGTGTNTGSNPFGLLYFGSLDATGGGTAVSEAGAIGLLALALGGIAACGATRRRTRR